MAKYFKQKLIFLGIIIAIFSMPSFAHGQSNIDWSKTNQYCTTWTQDTNNLIQDNTRKTGRICYPTQERCDAGVKELKKQWEGSVFMDGLLGQTTTQFTECVIVRNAEISEMIRPTAETLVSTPGKCNSLTNFSPIACIKLVSAFSVALILWIMSWILTAANQIFNLSVYISIEKFSGYANTDSIKFIWGLGRDLANVFFIFILMYIAIATIIQKSGIDTKKMVVRLIVTALLINFSIIIPKVIIDVGNSLAIVFYKNMGTPGSNGVPDIGTTLVKNAGPQQFYKGGLELGSSADELQVIDWSTIIITGLGTVILMGILCYVLLIAAYLFFFRTITLIILIATSSLVFFSQIIPNELGLNQWNQWFRSLIKETFFAPAFLFMFYLVLKVATETSPEISQGWIDNIFKFILLVGLSLGSIMVARKMATESGKLASQIKNQTRDKLATVGKYGGGSVARNTVGRLANKFADSDWAKNKATNNPNTYGRIRDISTTIGNAKFGSKKGYVDSSKSRGETLKKRLDGLDNEQKARYISNMNSGDRNTLYQQGLGDEDRSKIEGAAIGAAGVEATIAGTNARTAYLTKYPGDTTGADLAEKNAKEAHIVNATEFITSQRKNLSGEEKTKTYVQRIKGAKTGADKIKLLSELSSNEKELKAVIKGLDEPNLVKIKNDTSFGSDANIKKAVEDKIGGMDASETEKIEKEEKKQKEKQEISERKSIIDLINTEILAGTSSTLTSEINKLSKGDMNNLSKESIDHIANRSDMLNKMKPEALIALYKNPRLTDHDALLGKFDAIANNRIPGVTPSNSIIAINKGPAMLIT